MIQSGQSRLSERVNWATIQFLLENTVFLLIGLQAKAIIAANSESELSGLRIAGFCAAVLRRRDRHPDALGPAVPVRSCSAATGTHPEVTVRGRDALVIGWAGLRGVVTLAAAFLIPTDVPVRETLIFAAMVVTAGTLLLQGLTLPFLVRALGLRGPDAALGRVAGGDRAADLEQRRARRISTTSSAPRTRPRR